MSGRRSRWLWKVATLEAQGYLKTGELTDRNVEAWRNARYAEIKRTWTRRDHRPGCKLRIAKRSQADKAAAAIERGRAAKRERQDIYRQFPQLRHTGTPEGARWMPLANLRRAARKLRAA